MIKGLDHGYLYTKDNERRLFKSAFTRYDKRCDDNSHIIINGESYYFGYGLTTVDKDKINSEITKVSTMANVATSITSCPNEEIYLVVGLPIDQYKSKKDKFAKSIMNYNSLEVEYKGRKFRPNIKDVTVFAQGAGVLFKAGVDDGEYIVVDIGSMTVNVLLIEVTNGIPRITTHHTWYNGVLTLFESVIEITNLTFDLTLNMEYGEKIIKNNKLNVRGENVDMKYLKYTIEDYFSTIVNNIKKNYPYATTPIIFSGGGSLVLKEHLLKLFNNSIVFNNSQFANADGYYRFGLQKYGKYVRG